MIDEPYRTKEVAATYEKKKEPTVALHPEGHQLVFSKELLRLNGFATQKEAEEAGWRFK